MTSLGVIKKHMGIMSLQKQKKKKDNFASILKKTAFLLALWMIVVVLVNYKRHNNKFFESVNHHQLQTFETIDKNIQQVTIKIEQSIEEKLHKSFRYQSVQLFRETVHNKKRFEKISIVLTKKFNFSSSAKTKDQLKIRRLKRSSNQPYVELQDHLFFQNDQKLHSFLLDALTQDQSFKDTHQFNLNQLNQNREKSFKEKLGIESLKMKDNFPIFVKAKSYCQDQINILANSTKINSSNHEEKTKNEDEEKHEHKKCKQEKRGNIPAFWAVLYIFVVFCLFVALAIICDEFFVPSLEAISEKLNLSEDVAGATFMAAGSSAPELFTSVAGMGTGSDVGVGTIVGSAVFNLLVIIALTSSLCGRVLQLDWRPLVRDSLFYGFSIVTFILFSWDAVFVWWESACLLLLYGLYILAMKFNSQLMDAMKSTTCCACFEMKTGRVSPDQKVDIEMVESKSAETSSPQKNLKINSNTDQVKDRPVPSLTAAKPIDQCDTIAYVNKHHCCCCCCSCNSNCRREIQGKTSVEMETSDVRDSSFISKQQEEENVNNVTLCAECSETTITQQSYKEEPCTSKAIAANDEGVRLSSRSNESSPDTVNTAHFTKQRSNSPPPPYDEATFSTKSTKCHIAMTKTNLGCECVEHKRDPERRTRIIRSAQMCCCCFSRHRENNRIVFVEEIYQEVATAVDDLKQGLPETSIKTDLSTPPDSKAASNKPPLSAAETIQPKIISTKEDSAFSDFLDLNRNHIWKGIAGTPDEINSNNESGSDMLVVFPCLPPIRHSTPNAPESSQCLPSAKYILKWVVYVISFPWICAFTWSVPDCSKPENRKWFLFSFTMSIGWIAAISYVMVEIVEKIGCLLNVDNYTMGLVVIAIGTSVPDAISSILVAKAGHGDMAVSNAIGSNVFDINLGLGLPFFLTNIITGKPVHLLSSMEECLLDVLPLSLRMIPHVKFGLILLLILLLCLIVFFAVRFRLHKAVGYLFVSMYVIFMIYAFIQEKACYGFFC